LNNNAASRANIGWSLYNPTHQPIPGYAKILPTAANSTGANAGATTATATTVVYSSGDATDLAAFITDRLWFTDTVSLIAGLRVDQYRANYRSTTVAGSDSVLKAPNFLFAPRASLVWEPDEDQTYYFSWAKSATPQGTSVVGTPNPLSATNAALKPEKSENIEVGAKFSLFDGALGLSGSVFRVQKGNATQVDPVSGEVNLQSSQKQRVQGFEGQVTGEVLPHLNLTVSYTYLDPVITSDLSCAGTPTVCVPNPVTQGRQITFVPKNAVSLWGDYDAKEWLPGFSFGGGLVYQSHLFNNYSAPSASAYPLGRIVRIPETVELDTVLAYKVDRYNFQLNINNLTDRLNYAQSFGNRGTPAAGRTFIFSVGTSL
jgi:catecholate siderophore receptor